MCLYKGDRVRVIETFGDARLYDIGTVICDSVGSIAVEFDVFRPGFHQMEYDNNDNKMLTKHLYYVPEHRLELYYDINLKRLEKLKNL
jgi:hypothetical protein